MPDNRKRLRILVVHGVGEQKRFEYLEEVACNFYRALQNDPSRKKQATIQIRRGDQVARHAPAESWKYAPAIVNWETPDGETIELQFCEVYWADLDTPPSLPRFLKLFYWGLSISGLRFFTDPAVGPAKMHLMREPDHPQTTKEKLCIRTQLFISSLIFFYLVISVFLINSLSLKKIPFFNNFRNILHNYLGDVKLYQDWHKRNDNRFEVIGEKSRVAIRRRMIRALVTTANQVLDKDPDKKLDGYYIFSHSLGTVVALNGLMETELALPNYLDEEDWKILADELKATSQTEAPSIQMPKRRPWLTLRDTIDRQTLFSGLRGFVTVGSPLDKFAALWTPIVRINDQPIKKNCTTPWINVADTQDIVASTLESYHGCNDAEDVSGLTLTNIQWSDQTFLAAAHTSYWKAKKKESDQDRLIERIVPWLEGQEFRGPHSSINQKRAIFTYWTSLIVLSIGSFLAYALLTWCLFLEFIFGPANIPSFLNFSAYFLGISIITIVILSIIRYAHEHTQIKNSA